MKRKTFFLFFLALILPFYQSKNAYAQNAMALIDEVNALRAEKNLQPYVIDNNVMSMAQSHSDYQSFIKKSTHDRADGSAVPARAENVCAGAGVTARYCARNMWTDQLHYYTMVGLDSGTIGAGFSSSEGVNYYTLMVNSAGAETGLASLSVAPTAIVSANENASTGLINQDALPVQPGEFATSTPHLDGSIYHVVQSNETLWTIAINYGRTIAEIQALNGMAESNKDVMAGRRLLIVYGGTPVADTLTPSVTPPPVTNTPKATSTVTATLPPLDTLTPTITLTATPEPIIRYISFFDTPQARPLGMALVIISVIGLAITVYGGFYRS